jgi:hypothetical protein
LGIWGCCVKGDVGMMELKTDSWRSTRYYNAQAVARNSVGGVSPRM